MPATYRSKEVDKVKTQFPRPKLQTVRDTDKKKNAVEFFKYWKSLAVHVPGFQPPDKELAELCEVRVYRCWPIVDLRLAEPTRQTIEIELFTGPMPFDDPDEYRDWFCHRYGSGEWRCELSERGVQGSVLQTYFTAIDDRFPPRVDPSTLVRDAYQNRDYIRQLRQRGTKIPWDDPEYEEGGDMTGGSGDALRTMTDATVRLSEKGVELAEKVADAKVEAARNATPSEESVAVNKSIEMVTKTAESMIDMVTKNSGKQYDPCEILKTAAEIIRTPARSDEEGGSSWSKMTELLLTTVKESNAQVMKAQADQIDLLKTIVLRKNPDGSFSASESQAEPPKTFVEQAQEYKQIFELLGLGQTRAVSRPAAAAEAASSEKGEKEAPFAWLNEQTIVPICGLVTTGLMLIANMVHNWSVGRTGQGTPEKPEDVIRKAQAQPGAAPAGDQPAPQDSAATWTQFLKELEGPFISHFFNEGGSGYTLAQFIQTDGTMSAPTPNGRRVYVVLKERLKLEGFDTLIRGYHPIWSKVQGTPQKYSEFLKEFFNYDEYVAEQRTNGQATTVAN